MWCFWEQTGALGPIYRLLGHGLNASDIARKLDLTELTLGDAPNQRFRYGDYDSTTMSRV
jgi:hypothetical protein